MTPLKPVSASSKLLLGIAFFVLFVALWSFATLGGFVSKTFLADPLTMVREGVALFTQHGFAKDVAITIWRVVGGFVLAAAFAVPLGIMMGAYKPIEAFFEPFVSFARYLPASAFIPLLILWAGIGEMQKLLVIFIGSFFQIVLMVAVTVGATRRDLVEAAYTLGANANGVVRRVLLPSAAPSIAETLRLVLGWAWTYVIVVARPLSKSSRPRRRRAQTSDPVAFCVARGKCLPGRRSVLLLPSGEEVEVSVPGWRHRRPADTAPRPGLSAGPATPGDAIVTILRRTAPPV